MEKEITTSGELVSKVNDWKTVLEHLSERNFNPDFYKEVRIIKENEGWIIQSIPSRAGKGKSKIQKFRWIGVNLFDLNW